MEPSSLTKYCKKCNQSKMVSCFSKAKKSKDGLQPKCKRCVKEYQTLHKDHISSYFKKRYEVDKERIAGVIKKYYEENREPLLSKTERAG